MRELIRSPYAKIFLSGLLVFIVAAFFSVGYHQPDEHFQILEFCNYKLGRSPATDLAMEFKTQSRPTLQPYLAYVIIKSLNAIGIENPFTWAFVLRLLTAISAWFVICKLSLLFISDFVTEKGKKIFIQMSLLLWFVPYLCVRFSSENLSAITLLYAIYFLLSYLKQSSKPKIAVLVLTGLLLGFSFFFRFQIASAIIGLIAWMIFIKKMSWKEISVIAGAGIVSMAICVFLDHQFYGTWEITPYNYFHYNFIEGKLAGSGIDPWWSYFQFFIIQAVPPISIVLLVSFIIGVYKKPTSVFSFCIIPFLIFHILIGHKEMRFLFPMLFGFIYLTAIAIDACIVKYKPKAVQYTFIILAVVNIPLLAYRTLAPAQEAMKCYQFLYNYAKDKQVTVLCKERSVYKLVGWEVNFFKSPNVNAVVMKNDDEIINYLHKNNSQNVLIFNEHSTLDTVFNNFPTKRIYCLLPEWMDEFDFNKWEERARLWSIYEISNNSKPN